MKMSVEARRVMNELSQAYVQAGYPNVKAWARDRKHFGSAGNELQALGLLQSMTPRALRLTDKGRDWVVRNQVPDEIRWARVLFGIFEKEYAQHTSGQWWFKNLEDLEAGTVGLDLQQTRFGVKVLLQKGLISSDASGEGSLELTDFGKDTCLHPETLDARLGPRSTLVDASTTNVFHGPAQVGDGNVQNITNAVILQQIIEQIEKDPVVTPEQKSRWVDTLKDIIASTVGTAVAAGAQGLF